LEVWIQILLISLAISIFSQFLNRIMKLDPKHMKESQARLQELSRELDASRGVGVGAMNVQAVGKPARSYEEINQELMVLMKKMAKEQFLPMILRCGIFWGIFALLGAIYGSAGPVLTFDVLFFGREWVGAYVMFSFIFSMSFFGLQKLYKKITHQDKRVATPGTSELAISARPSWKERLEAAKKEFEGEERPSDSPVQ
jgi:uncharacterized membrane protein (DUF106 family)